MSTPQAIPEQSISHYRLLERLDGGGSLMLFDFPTRHWSVWLHTEDGTVAVGEGRQIHLHRTLSRR